MELINQASRQVIRTKHVLVLRENKKDGTEVIIRAIARALHHLKEEDGYPPSKRWVIVCRSAGQVEVAQDMFRGMKGASLFQRFISFEVTKREDKSDVGQSYSMLEVSES